MWKFVGVDLGIAPAPDETTVLRFRHLLDQHDLGWLMLDAVNLHLEAKGIKIQTGMIVYATILHAPSSTKNEEKERDLEMRQTKKGNQWYFGLKAHIGVDAREGTMHTLVTTSANVADSTVLPDLLHGEECKVWATAAIRARPKPSKRSHRRPRT